MSLKQLEDYVQHFVHTKSCDFVMAPRSSTMVQLCENTSLQEQPIKETAKRESSVESNTSRRSGHLSPERHEQEDMSSRKDDQEEINKNRHNQGNQSPVKSGGLWTESIFLAGVPPCFLGDPDIQEMATKFRRETERHEQLKREVRQKHQKLEEIGILVKM